MSTKTKAVHTPGPWLHCAGSHPESPRWPVSRHVVGFTLWRGIAFGLLISFPFWALLIWEFHKGMVR